MPTEKRDHSSAQNSGEAGFIEPEILDFKTREEDLVCAQNRGNYGEFPPGYDTMPGVREVGYLGKDTEKLLKSPSRMKTTHPAIYKTIVDLQGAGKTIHAKWDAHKGVTLVIGTAIALGAVGGLVLREYKKKHK